MSAAGGCGSGAYGLAMPCGCGPCAEKIRAGDDAPAASQDAELLPTWVIALALIGGVVALRRSHHGE